MASVVLVSAVAVNIAARDSVDDAQRAHDTFVASRRTDTDARREGLDALDSAERSANISYGLFAVSAVAGGLATYLWLDEPLVVAPRLERGAGLSMTVHW